jgi:DNA repair protein RecO
MNLRQEIAITLRTSRFEERHLWVTGLTANFGKVKALARNAVASRRFGGTLDLCAVSVWHWQEKENGATGALTAAEIREDFSLLRKSIDRLTCGSYIIELTERVAPERQPAPELFKLLINSMSWLNEAPEEHFNRQAERFLVLFLGKILQVSGTQPCLHECHLCKTPLLALKPESLLTPTADYTGLLCAKCWPSSRTAVESISQALVVELWQALGLTMRNALQHESKAPRAGGEMFRWIELFVQRQLVELKLAEFRSRPMLLTFLKNIK